MEVGVGGFEVSCVSMACRVVVSASWQLDPCRHSLARQRFPSSTKKVDSHDQYG